MMTRDNLVDQINVARAAACWNSRRRPSMETAAYVTALFYSSLFMKITKKTVLCEKHFYTLSLYSAYLQPAR